MTEPSPVNLAVVVRCNGCDALMGNVISTLCAHDRSCSWHDADGCTHGGYCYRDADDTTYRKVA